MAKVLIVYGTTKGQTEKIAYTIAEELRLFGHFVMTVNSKKIVQPIDPAVFDVIFVGASVHASDYQKSLVHWVKAHVDVLREKPSAFFSVCLGIMQKEESVQTGERQIVEKFFANTGWQPKHWTIFAGALAYTKYNWYTRWVMKRIAKKAGGDTDTSRDHEYTNWQDVRNFAREVAGAAAEAKRGSLVG